MARSLSDRFSESAFAFQHGFPIRTVYVDKTKSDNTSIESKFESINPEAKLKYNELIRLLHNFPRYWFVVENGNSQEKFIQVPEITYFNYQCKLSNERLFLDESILSLVPEFCTENPLYKDKDLAKSIIFELKHLSTSYPIISSTNKKHKINHRINLHNKELTDNSRYSDIVCDELAYFFINRKLLPSSLRGGLKNVE